MASQYRRPLASMKLKSTFTLALLVIAGCAGATATPPLPATPTLVATPTLPATPTLAAAPTPPATPTLPAPLALFLGRV